MGFDREEASRARDASPKPSLPGRKPTLGRNRFCQSPFSRNLRSHPGAICASSVTEQRRAETKDRNRAVDEVERRTTNVKGKRGIGNSWNKVIALGR
jgi:hypothetical protein